VRRGREGRRERDRDKDRENNRNRENGPSSNTKCVRALTLDSSASKIVMK
jgi:hypothetical protein